MRRILVVDDERNIRASLCTTFQLEGYTAEAAEDGQGAVEAVGRGDFDLIVMDMQMPRLDGLGALRELRERGCTTPVIFLTAHGTIERAVETIKLGAFDFIEKPPHAEKILLAARNALRQADLEEENRELRDEARVRFDMVGSAPPMQRLFEQIQRIAPTQARVLILGENGTGKELIAHALHRHSPRASAPFVRVNCAAIPSELFESELFGHERGAFTGATSRRRGKFVRAHGGTLFFDEVAEIPSPLQAKLLRALESGEVEPVGADREVQVDVRVLAATNRDLEAAVADGSFRQDLYYRLQVVTVEAPALRDRKEDIPALCELFLRLASQENRLPAKRLTPEALDALTRHDYPGNVRELRNLIERLVILTPSATVDADAVEAALPRTRPDGAGGTVRLVGTLRDSMTAVERTLLLEALESHRWKMTATAQALGLERSHLYKKLKALGIERE